MKVLPENQVLLDTLLAKKESLLDLVAKCDEAIAELQIPEEKPKKKGK